jgi:glycosyltransferase involved in cell wall biosynthesis
LDRVEAALLTVVLPVLNEEMGVGFVLDELKREGYENILVVDGYSTDGTADVASLKGVKVIHQEGRGKTGAIRTAIENVDTPYILIMDGDCTYRPRDIKNFFPHIYDNNEVIGVRFQGRNNIPVLNRFGNFLINYTFNALFGTRLSDVCSGMYALKTDFAENIGFKTYGFDVEVEIAAHAVRKGTIAEVPIGYSSRIGQQKLSPLRDGLKIYTTIWKLAWGI